MRVDRIISEQSNTKKPSEDGRKRRRSRIEKDEEPAMLRYKIKINHL
jgi:hypothetical protein